MEMDRRKFIIRSIGAAICAGLAPHFIPSLIPDLSGIGKVLADDEIGKLYSVNSDNMLEILKELYARDIDYVNAVVYSKNPMLSLVPKTGFQGSYIPVPLIYRD